MKIATLNINSINAHLEVFLKFLLKDAPDIILLQEIKTEYNSFPFFEINAAGYQAKVLGQKGYNGVAILSKESIKLREENLPDFEDMQARYLEVLYKDIVISSVYMPNGNPLGSDKFDYKLKFMDAFYDHASNLLKEHDKVVLGGDFNVILSAFDVYDENAFKDNALYAKEVRQKLTALKYLGYYDTFKMLHPNDVGYTYWNYAAGAFERDMGLRIDYLWCSASMIEKLKECTVQKDLRQGEKTSDHTALVGVFED